MDKTQKDTWKRLSQGWQAGATGVKYTNHSNDKSIWRTTPSLLSSPTVFNNDFTIWKTEMLLQSPPSGLLSQERARGLQNRLGGILPVHRGGIYLYNESKTRAVGFVISDDSSCFMESLEKRGRKWASIEQKPGLCNEFQSGKPIKLGLICSRTADHCKGYLRGQNLRKPKEKVTLENVGLGIGTWQYAFGCLNGTCSFKSMKTHNGN